MPSTAPLVPLQASFAGMFAFVLLVFWVSSMVWVYTDARKNSPDSAVLWTLVIFFGWILGLLLYVILGREAPAARRRRRSRPGVDSSGRYRGPR